MNRILAAGAALILACIALPHAGSAQVAAPATPPPAGLVLFTGQLLDVRGGYVYFTTGDAFRLVAVPRYTDYATGAPTMLLPRAGLYARAVLDPTTRLVTQLDLTTRRLALDKQYNAVRSFAVVASTPIPAPEIKGTPITGKAVPVVFIVTVPPNTPLAARIYISTDVSGWDPRAIEMDRINGQQYRVVRTFASGTKFAYRVTRGSWTNKELGENGLEAEPHLFTVKESDTQSARAVVYAWADQRANQSEPEPGAVPTPFNANPYGVGGNVPPPPVLPRTYQTPRPGTNPNLPH
jgi:hypothetical protein